MAPHAVLAGLVAGAINLVLDPFLMFNRGMGIKGAAAATAIAQYAAALFALKKLAFVLLLQISCETHANHMRPVCKETGMSFCCFKCSLSHHKLLSGAFPR